MLLGNLTGAALIALIPLLHASRALSFPVLLVIVFAVGAPYILYQASQVVILPDLVGDDDQLLTKANALLLGANRTTVLLGAPIAGVLIGLIGATAVLWVDSGTFLIAFLLIALLVPRGKAIPETTSAQGLFVGLRTLWTDRLLRTWTVTVSAFEMGWQLIFAAIPVLVFFSYAHHPQVAGILFGTFGGGALAGNLLVLPLLRHRAPLRLAVIGKVIQALTLWVLVATSQVVVVGAVLAIAGACTGLIGGPTTAVQTKRVPAELRARTLSAYLTITLVAGAIGLFIGAPVMQAAGVRTVFLLVALAHTIGGFFFVRVTLRASKLPAAVKSEELV
jgi:predicted MFS family arabinose efflux permease